MFGFQGQHLRLALCEVRFLVFVAEVLVQHEEQRFPLSRLVTLPVGNWG